MSGPRLRLVVWALFLLCLVSSLGVSAPVTARLTVTNSGLQDNGGSWWPSLSADGRFMAYHSWADNITAGDTNWVYDVYVLDRLFGLSHLISVSSEGIIGDEESLYPMISADGCHVAFCSAADNLAPGDAAGVQEIYVRDWETGVTERASVSTSGEPADGPCNRPSVSGDGRYVVFQSTAGNLVPGVGGGLAVYLRDRVARTTTCVSVSSTGEVADEQAFEPAITPNGRYVVFSSWAGNLVPGDTNTQRDVFVRDLQAGLTDRVSLSSTGAQGTDVSGGGRCAITPDGRYVAFSSVAPNLVPGDTNGVCDVFVRDRLLGTTERVSVSSSGGQGDAASGEDGYILSISADGRYVAFASLADNLVPGDTNSAWDVFVHDRQTGTTTCASVSAAGFQGNGDSGYYGLALESHGAFVVFDSRADNLIEGDTDNVMDVYLRGDDTPTGVPVAIINDDAVYTTSTSVTLSVHPGDYSELRYSSDGVTWTAWEASATTRAWALADGDGSKRVYVQGRSGESESEVTWDDIILDTAPPSGLALTIDGGASETATRAVTLSLTCSGAATMRLRNETDDWSPWVAFAASYAWTLSAGSGTKHVSVEARSVAGNVSAEAWDEISFNPTPPTGIGILINGDEPATGDPAVTLDLSTTDSTEMRFRDEGGIWTAWEPFAATRAWPLPLGDGVKRVYAQGRDADLVTSPETWDEIVLDTTPPSDVSLSINNGAGYTNDASVTLTVTATGATEMRFQNEDGGWSAWEPAAMHRDWPLSAGDGLKTVYLEARDAVGNISDPVSAQITLDTQPPATPTLAIDGGAASTFSHRVSLSSSSTGAAQMRFRNEAEAWSDWQSFTPTADWTLSAPRGEKTVSVQCRDAAGNLSTEADATIQLINFADVSDTQWAYPWIMSCVDAGIVGGYWDGTYRPDLPVDRATMAVYISRALAGSDADVPPGPGTPSFPDVPTGHWAFRYVEYAKARSIVGGYWDGTYRPDLIVDRAQMAVFVARSMCNPTGDAGLTGYTPPATPTFPDVLTTDYSYRYVEYCQAEGVVGGYWDGTYRPGLPVDRASMAVYVARAFALP